MDMSYRVLPDQTNNLLVLAIYEGACAHEQMPDLHYQRRKACKVVAGAASAVAKVPYIPMALKLSGGPLFAATNSIGFFVLEYWAISETIDDMLKPQGFYAMELSNRSDIDLRCRAVVVASSIGISLIGQIPTSLPALDYDKGWEEIGFILSMAAGSLLPVRSTQLSIEKSLRLRRYRNDVTKKLEKARTMMMACLKEFEELYIQSGQANQLATARKTRSKLLLQESEVQNGYRFVASCLSIPISRGRQALEKIAKFSGLFLTSSFQTALTLYTYDKTKTHINEAAGVFFAAIVVSSSVYLTGKSIINTSNRVAQTVCNFLFCKARPSLAEQMRPKIAYSLKAFGLLVDGLALGPTEVIWSEFFEGNVTRQQFFQFTISASIYLLLFTATLDMVDSIIEDVIRAKGTSEEKEVLQFRDDIRKIAQLMEIASQQDFAEFLLEAPREVWGANSQEALQMEGEGSGGSVTTANDIEALSKMAEPRDLYYAWQEITKKAGLLREELGEILG